MHTNKNRDNFSAYLAARAYLHQHAKPLRMRRPKLTTKIGVDQAKPLTGCLSTVSQVRIPSREYRQALREFRCAIQNSMAGDYVLSLRNPLPDSAFEPTLAGMPDRLDLLQPRCEVSEEEIENCGYLAWLI